jgi:hypothetical protein
MTAQTRAASFMRALLSRGADRRSVTMTDATHDHLRRCAFQLACLSAELADMCEACGERGGRIAEAAAVVAHTSEALIASSTETEAANVPEGRNDAGPHDGRPADA